MPRNHLVFLYTVLLFLGSLVVAFGNIQGHAITTSLTFLLACQLFFKEHVHHLSRIILFIIICLISISMTMHYMPGFYNIEVIESYKISENSSPNAIWLNFDQLIVGYGILFFAYKAPHSFDEIIIAFQRTYKVWILAVVILMAAALISKLIMFEFKIPKHLFLFLVINLFITCIYEEGLYRLTMQQTLEKWFGRRKFGRHLAILFSAIIFGLIHLLKTGIPIYALITVIAGIFYGLVYSISRRIEMSIMLHFLVNTIHIIFFTYPFSVLFAFSY